MSDLLRYGWGDTSGMHWGGSFGKSQLMWLTGRVEIWRLARCVGRSMMRSILLHRSRRATLPHPGEHWYLLFHVVLGHIWDSWPDIGKRMCLNPQVTNRTTETFILVFSHWIQAICSKVKWTSSSQEFGCLVPLLRILLKMPLMMIQVRRCLLNLHVGYQLSSGTKTNRRIGCTVLVLGWSTIWSWPLLKIVTCMGPKWVENMVI